MKNPSVVRRTSAVVLVALVASLGVSLLGASPAAATGCSSAACAGHDPVAEGCTTAGWFSTTSANLVVNGTTYATVQNVYSHGCNVNWARAILTPAALSSSLRMFVFIYTTDRNGNSEGVCYPGPSNTGKLSEDCTYPQYAGGQWAFTDMVDGTNLTHAVVFVTYPGNSFFGSAQADQ
jgi:hypothetical protein